MRSSKYLVYDWFYRNIEFERIRTIFFKKKNNKKKVNISRQQGIIINT